MKRWRGQVRIGALLPGALLAAGVHAANVTVVDAGGQPVPEAVVYFHPVAGKPPAAAQQPAFIEQARRRFVPGVTVVQTGTAIHFPNKDTVRHHVYSFSPAKVFELKLYAGTPSEPVVFDKPGTVVLGCNIHDQMVGYVHVVDTPWFAKTDDGGVGAVPGLPPGEYRLRVWHRGMSVSRPPAEKTVAVPAADAALRFVLDGPAPASPAAR